LNQLYKHTQLQTTFNAILLVISDGKPKVMNIRELLQSFIDHRKEVIRRATQFDLDKAQKRAHILEGFKVALAHIDEIIKIIKKAPDRESAEKRLIAKYDLSKEQAEAILNMRLFQLTNLEAEKIEKEYLELIKEIERLQSILASEKKVLNIIKNDMDEIVKRYSDVRRTEIVADEQDIDIEDLIADQGCVITVSHRGYIKRTAVSLYKKQKRGGKGVSGVDMITDDFVEHLFTASTHDYILIFTQKGQLHWLKVYMIPEGGRVWRGKAIVNILSIPGDDPIADMIRVRSFDDKFSVVMCSRKGIVKKTNLSEFSNPRKTGIRAINIHDDDALISAKLCQKGDNILLLSRNGLSIQFQEDKVREMGRTAAGVIGIRLGKKDEVVGCEVVSHDLEGTLLVVCEKGYGKRTRIKEYRLQGRGGKGIIAIKASERNGRVVSALKVDDSDEIMVMTTEGKMVRQAVKGISVIGRNTQGVRIIELGKTDKVVGVSRVEENKEDSVEQEAGEEEGTEGAEDSQEIKESPEEES
ncbi:MAG: DNA gyrase subunit A, partial [Candidatus Aureabacteria bacterium]|nr:DNA gyrase subunit A [Candidatus Auribacterota bacterium]